MEKEIYIKKFRKDEFDELREERPPRPDRPPHDRPPRPDRDFHKEHRKVIKFDMDEHRGISKTKLFTDKEAMVSHVNEMGELGHRIEIFKIEESLYKVVVHEKPIFNTKE